MMQESFEVWVDAQLPPGLARFLARTLDVDAHHVEEVGLREASDPEIFRAAQHSARPVVLVTKDDDFPKLLAQCPPPQVVWIRCGNVRNAELYRLIHGAWPKAASLPLAKEPLVEIRRNPS